jgi:hypothetical protein
MNLQRRWLWGHLPHADEQLCRDMSVSNNKSSVIQASRDSYVSNLDVQQTDWIFSPCYYGLVYVVFGMPWPQCNIVVCLSLQHEAWLALMLSCCWTVIKRRLLQPHNVHGYGDVLTILLQCNGCQSKEKPAQHQNTASLG